MTSLSNPNGGRGRGRGVSNKLACPPVMPAFLPISKCNVANVANCTKLTFNCIYQLHLGEGCSRSTDHQKATATIDLLLIRRLCTKMHIDTHLHRRRQPTHKTPFFFVLSTAILALICRQCVQPVQISTAATHSAFFDYFCFLHLLYLFSILSFVSKFSLFLFPFVDI